MHVYADALRFCDRVQPLDDLQARFSIQHALAAWLIWGEPQLSHYQSECLGDATLGALRTRIVLHEDERIEARYPAQYGARVELRLRDGRCLQAELQDTWGDPARPMPLDALIGKAHMLMQSARWSQSRIDQAIAACLALPEAGDLSALNRALLQ